MTFPLLPKLILLLDTLIPPRKTERVVQGLTIDTLQKLKDSRGFLPYHEPSVMALVWELKYKKNTQALKLATEFLEEELTSLCEDSIGKVILIPTPMHKTRKKDRGFNPAEEMCEALFAKSEHSFSYAPHALQKIRNTLPQQGLPKHRREKNLKGAMKVMEPNAIMDAVCVVIDDVKTTGATAQEATRALIEGGAREVHVLALAHS